MSTKLNWSYIIPAVAIASITWLNARATVQETIFDIKLNEDLAALRMSANESRELMQKIMEGLDPRTPLLPIFDEDLNQIRRNISEPVSRSILRGILEDDRFPATNEKKLESRPIVMLDAADQSKLVKIEFEIPVQKTSDTEKCGPISLRLYVTGGRSQACMLFRLLEGRIFPNQSVLQESPDKSARQEEMVEGLGDVSLRYCNRWVLSVALPEGHDGAGRDAIVFLRNNVVVELRGGSYYYDDLYGDWRTLGLSLADQASLIEILKRVDTWIKERAKD